MKYDFAALRFCEDENIKDRVYWYLSDLPLKENEEALAPVGVHDRLQKARVERLTSAEEEDAPYDVRLIKRVAAKMGARKLSVGGASFVEFGGVRYDDRHYTRFSRVIYSEEKADKGELALYGFHAVFEAPMSEDDGIYREIVRGHGIALLGGEGKKIMNTLFALLQGKKDAADFLYSLGLYEGELASLLVRLG